MNPLCSNAFVQHPFHVTMHFTYKWVALNTSLALFVLFGGGGGEKKGGKSSVRRRKAARTRTFNLGRMLLARLTMLRIWQQRKGGFFFCICAHEEKLLVVVFWWKNNQLECFS